MFYICLTAERYTKYIRIPPSDAEHFEDTFYPTTSMIPIDLSHLNVIDPEPTNDPEGEINYRRLEPPNAEKRKTSFDLVYIILCYI